MASQLTSSNVCAVRVPKLSAAISGVQLHERALCCFQAYLFVRALFAPLHNDKLFLCGVTASLCLLSVSTVLLRQRVALDSHPIYKLLYRAGLVLPVLGAYLLLRRLIPTLGVPSADAALLQVDNVLLGHTPALLLAQFATPNVVEWFSFFYFGYYFLFLSHIALALRLSPDARTQELLFGLVIVTVLGHASYTLVPGVGPYAYEGLHFAHALRGGVFFARVESAVETAGAHLDIFPSLHTAHPLFIALHAFRYRRAGYYRWTWPLIAFAAANMIVSTMLLRFHYAIDVAAGVALACGAHAFVVHVRYGPLAAAISAARPSSQSETRARRALEP